LHATPLGEPVAESGSTSYDFGLIGDLPYSADDVQRGLPNLVADLNRYKSLRFVVHDGDIKAAAGISCSDHLFSDRRRQFKSMAAPFILLFGDNDWADCVNRADPASKQLDDQRRALAAIRKEFTTDEYGDDLNLHRRGSTYPEIVHWTVGHIRYVGLNVPGPDNNEHHGFESEYQPRNAANIAELNEAFDAALHPRPRQDLRAIVIIFQAKPFARTSLKEGMFSEDRHFTELLGVIKKGAADISPRPVVLVHGDSHVMTIDQPMRTLGNFIRVSTFGTPSLHWIRVRVDSNDPSVFAFHVQIVSQNLVTPPDKTKALVE
jgi:hypothetical protein